MPHLKHFGWTPTLQKHFDNLAEPHLVAARVARVDRGRVELLGCGDGRFATLPGRFHLEEDGLTLPTTGDWIACRSAGEELVVHTLLPRTSCFVRKSAGQGVHAQPIAANIDRVLILTAVGGDFSPARVERYLAATLAGGAEAVVVLSKSDLSGDPEVERAQLGAVAAHAPVVSLNAVKEGGTAELDGFLEPGKTLALVGSSGVGKSTLANKLLGVDRFATAAVRESDDTGRHQTTRRELVLAPGGYLLIDTPGMREFGLWDASAGLESAFSDVTSLAEECRFRDCSHTNEPGCAVARAIASGRLASSRYERFQGLSAELSETESKAQQRTKKDQWHQQIASSSRQRRKLHRKLGLKED